MTICVHFFAVTANMYRDELISSPIYSWFIFFTHLDPTLIAIVPRDLLFLMIACVFRNVHMLCNDCTNLSLTLYLLQLLLALEGGP